MAWYSIVFVHAPTPLKEYNLGFKYYPIASWFLTLISIDVSQRERERETLKNIISIKSCSINQFAWKLSYQWDTNVVHELEEVVMFQTNKQNCGYG